MNSFNTFPGHDPTSDHLYVLTTTFNSTGRQCNLENKHLDKVKKETHISTKGSDELSA